MCMSTDFLTGVQFTYSRSLNKQLYTPPPFSLPFLMIHLVLTRRNSDMCPKTCRQIPREKVTINKNPAIPLPHYILLPAPVRLLRYHTSPALASNTGLCLDLSSQPRNTTQVSRKSVLFEKKNVSLSSGWDTLSVGAVLSPQSRETSPSGASSGLTSLSSFPRRPPSPTPSAARRRYRTFFFSSCTCM